LRDKAARGGVIPINDVTLLAAADCIEQLQMPPAKVRELAGTEDGADSLALLRALTKQVEGQRKHIATLRAALANCEGALDKEIHK
jgi:hypothetical protein